MLNGGKLPPGMAYMWRDIFTFSCCHHEIYFPSFAFPGNLSLKKKIKKTLHTSKIHAYPLEMARKDGRYYSIDNLGFISDSHS